MCLFNFRLKCLFYVISRTNLSCDLTIMVYLNFNFHAFEWSTGIFYLFTLNVKLYPFVYLKVIVVDHCVTYTITTVSSI